MRILVHEFVSGGGLAGRPLPRSLAREGAAMLEALLADLVAGGGHQWVTTRDPRASLRVPPGVECVLLRGEYRRELREQVRAADAVWLIAPELHGCLAELAHAVEAEGRLLLGPSAAAIRRAADKAWLARALPAAGIPAPATALLEARQDPLPLAEALGFPVVAKPARGAGCQGVGLARDAAELPRAVAAARAAAPGEAVLLQRFVAGVHASVSLIADGRRAVPLAVGAQHLRLGARSAYRGGVVPLEHPLAPLAAERASGAARLVPGLRGYFGVDLVLTETDAVVIEINPRLTTAYRGVRAALDANPAALALAACLGTLPEVPPPARRIEFAAAGGRPSRLPLP